MVPDIRTVCPLCQSPKIVNEFNLDVYVYFRCSSCECLFVGNRVQTNLLINSYSKDYYEAESTDLNDRRGYPSYMGAQSTLEKSFQRKLNIVKQFVLNGYVLDAGAAYGTFLRMANSSNKAYSCIGLEISQYAADVAFHQFGMQVSLGSIENAPFPDQTFDAVVMWDVIEHLIEPVDALKEVLRILKPGGCVFISTDDVSNWLVRLFGQKWWGLAAPLHLCHFSKKGMQAALRCAGSFDLIGFYKDPRRYTFAEIIEHFGVSYKSGFLTKLGIWLKKSPMGTLGMEISRPEQFIVAARKM